MTIPAVDKIWMNGRLVDWGDAKIHVLSHTLHYGTGVFEGIRCYETDSGPAVFRLTDHLERMQRSARIVKLDIPFSTTQLRTATLELIRSNALGSCYIRPIAYRALGSLGLNPQTTPVEVAIAAWPWATYLGEAALREGIRVTLSSWRRNDPNVIPPDAKITGAYINACLATVEANEAGFDEAIMLNPQGYVSEGTGENIFLVKDGELITPSLISGLLPGITRASIITIAADLGMSVSERELTRADLYTADEMFCCGTAAEVTPIREIDGRLLEAPGPITKELQQKFFAVVKGDKKYADWLDFVDEQVP